MRDDTISRQAAIDAINKALDRETLLNSFVRKVAVDAVKALPSVDDVPVRRGKWIHYLDEFDGETTECSVCHVEGMLYGNYCPNCGARMEDSDG